MNNIPIPINYIKKLAIDLGIPAPGASSIREIVYLVNEIEKEKGVKFVRMEMGVPGLPSPSIGTDAEMTALKEGVAAIYPDIKGISPLKEETSRFLRLFLDINVDPQG